MIVVAGALYVDSERRASYLDGCRAVVELARATEGCHDFALSPDLLDARRINVFERWDSQEALTVFRGSGPSGEQQDAIQDADVREFVIDDTTSPR